jgi:hypothetical protein
MVQALRQHVPAGRLQFGVPDGRMYLWCELLPTAGAGGAGPRCKSR